MTVSGVLLCGAFAGLLQYAALGVDPFQCFCNGVWSVIPLNFGTLYVIINALLLLFALFADKHYIGLGTLINMFLLGYVVDFVRNGMQALNPAPSMALRVALFAVSLLGLCVTGSLYMTADLGVSTYDAVALIISNTWHKMQFRFCRILTDLVCVLIGGGLYLLSGKSFQQLTAIVGIGTILTAFCMGPVIAWCNTHISEPLLNK